MRDVYEGCIEVSEQTHVHWVDGVQEPIEGLDERVTSAPVLRFTLDYPFDRPYEDTIVTDAGASLRQIIDAVRSAYRRMYRGVTIEDVPHLDNKRVRGEFGEAMHVIEDLVIETIAVDDETGELEIFIGS